MKKFLVFTSMLFLLVGSLSAQEKTISGKVTSADDDIGLPGVNVLIEGTSTGTVTDLDGNYTISVPESGASLVFSFIGYISQTVQVGTQTEINVSLESDIFGLEEVVVTALGIKKQARSLTYSTQEVSGDELTDVKEVNMINSLAGKTAGVTITRNSSGVGASSKVVMRGNKSVLGNNQVLYVIDGIPMNNATGTQAVTLYGAFDGGDAISNLNPDDIESMTVLRGASASALYGSQGANGVVLINTKKGKEGVARIDFSSSMTFEKPLILPEVQESYIYEEYGAVSASSWGNASTSASNRHIRDFFETGSNKINSLAITNGNSLGQYYISYANTQANGIVDGNDLTKHNATFRGTTKIWNDRLSLDASFNYIKQDINNRPYGGFYFNPLVGLYLSPVGEDMSIYKSDFEVFSEPREFNIQNWPYLDSGEGYSHQNPYWVINRNTNLNQRNRTISTFSAKFDINSWMNIAGRLSYDRTLDDNEVRIYASTDDVIAHINGEYTKTSTANTQLYADLILDINKEINEDLNINGSIGFSSVETEFSSLYLSTQNDYYGINLPVGLKWANVFSVQSMDGYFGATEILQKALSQAIFATATIGYKNMLFLDLTGRNEWSSTLPDPSEPFFYKSGGLSYVLTESIGSNNILSYAKLRASFSEVGNDLIFGAANLLPPSRVYPGTFSNTAIAQVAAISILSPEKTQSIEFGAELKLLENKINLDLTYYNAKTIDQLLTVTSPVEVDYELVYILGGEIRNSGIEMSLSYKGIFNDFRWEPIINLSTNKNEIIHITDELENQEFILNTIETTKSYILKVKEGGSYGDMYGPVYERDANGNIVTQDGLPVRSADNEYLGNPNPDLLLGFANKFKYKNVSLSLLIDGRFGGEVISLTEALLDRKGLSERSGADRDNGSTVVDGVTFVPQDFYESVGGMNPLAEQYVYDATNIRLRELSIGYTFPKINEKVKELSISFVGRNLFFIKNEAPFDPETAISAGNGLQGLDAFNMPSTRTMGFNLKVSF